MSKYKSILDFKRDADNLKSVTPWDEIEINTVYHVPPIITLERRELLILSKTKDSATYRRIGDKEKKEKKMFNTSVFAKFLVKKKKF